MVNVDLDYCGSCGGRLQPDDRFCRGCGTPLTAPPTPQAAAPPANPWVGQIGPVPPSMPVGYGYSSSPPHSNQARVVAIVVVVGAILAAAGIGGAVLVATHGKRSSSSPAKVQTSVPRTVAPTAPYVPPTEPLRDIAGSRFVASYNQKEAGLRAVPDVPYGSSTESYAIYWQQLSNVWLRYQAQIQAITFPQDAAPDVAQLVRDLSALIQDDRDLAYDPGSPTDGSQSSTDLAKVDGDERVLAGDVGDTITNNQPASSIPG